jgi:hypothetical protein
MKNYSVRKAEVFSHALQHLPGRPSFLCFDRTAFSTAFALLTTPRSRVFAV